MKSNVKKWKISSDSLKALLKKETPVENLTEKEVSLGIVQMWQPISPSLYEHIDGLRSVVKKPEHKK